MSHILLNNVKTSDIPDLPDEVTGLYQKFLKHDVDQTLAYDLAEAMEDCFHDEKGRSIHQHLTALLRKLQDLVELGSNVTNSGSISWSHGC